MDAEEREIAASIAGQTAVAIKKVQLIDRLHERNAIKDFLEDLSYGARRRPSFGSAPRRSAATSREPHLVLQAIPRSEQAERALGARWRRRSRAALTRAFPGSLFDHRDSALRGLISLAGTDEKRRGAAAPSCTRADDAPPAGDRPLQPLRGPGRLHRPASRRPSTR